MAHSGHLFDQTF